jgi:hypothetical protein
VKITKTTLRRIIKEELDAVMQEGPLDMLRNLGRKKKTAAPAEPELTCPEVRQKYNEIAPETTYGTIGDNAKAMQDRLIRKHGDCFTDEEKKIAMRYPAKLVTGGGPMNEDEERNLESLWTGEVVTDVIGIMRAFGIQSGRPSTFLERHLEAADNLKAMMEEYNLSEEDLRAMMAYAKTLYSR